jgi:hypothetical protein
MRQKPLYLPQFLKGNKIQNWSETHVVENYLQGQFNVRCWYNILLQKLHLNFEYVIIKWHWLPITLWYITCLLWKDYIFHPQLHFYSSNTVSKLCGYGSQKH